jgi:hypothetical protein
VKRRGGAGRLLAVAAILFLAGCPRPEGRPPTYPVRGELFVSGQPAAGAAVELHSPDDPQREALRPHGVVAADGTFRLTTFASGAEAGVRGGVGSFARPLRPPGAAGPPRRDHRGR